MLRLILLYCLSFLCFSAQAKEGFSFQTPEPKLRTSWNATFLTAHDLKNDKTMEQAGSSALVRKTTVRNYTYLGFLTAGHVIRDLMHNFRDLATAMRSFRIYSRGQDDGRVPGAVIWVEKETRSDLGFFVMKINSNTAASFREAMFSSSCDIDDEEKLYMFGFPIVAFRPLKSRKVPIADPNTTRKRWSEGFYTQSQKKLANSQSASGVPSDTGTMDGLHGMSGGPVVNTAGEIVGIHVGGYSDDVYLGYEVAGKMSPYSFFASCEQSKDYADKMWGKFWNEMGANP